MQSLLQGLGLVTIAIIIAFIWSWGIMFATRVVWILDDFFNGVVIFLAIEGIIAIFILGYLL